MKKSNIKFLILQVIGIILVVLGHKGGINLFLEWFPIYSFHMPLFIFISGYFYKVSNENNLGQFILKRIKTLVVPYYIWNLFYGIIATVLVSTDKINFAHKIDFNYFFVEPWITGHQFGLNVAGWFVLALFLVQLIYVIFRRIMHFINIENEFVLMIILLVIGCLGILKANQGYHTGWYLPIVRTMFLLPIYHFGFLYKTHIEHKNTLNNILYFLILFIIQFVLIKRYGYLDFSVVFCNSFNSQNIFLPYITSVTGILFWMKVSEILVPSLKDSKVIHYIGNNTFDIMMHHQFVFFGLNVIFFFISKVIILNYFNFERLKNDLWYSYDAGDGRFSFFYVIAGISIPLLMKRYIFQNTKLIKLIRPKFNLALKRKN